MAVIRVFAILTIIISIYSFVDCATTPQEKVRKFPKIAWLIIIFLTWPIAIGSIGWFLVGRPKKSGPGKGGKRKNIPPDDNPDFLRKL